LMLQALRQNLLRLGRGRVFTLFTAREDSVWDDDIVRKDWRKSIDRMRTGMEIPEFRLRGFERDEAADLVRAAIPAVESYYAEAMIDQVGTSPFAIRESLGLLLERKALEPDAANGVWRLVDPDKMIRALDNQELRRATHYRLRGLRERYPGWLADFLDSGACLGTSFDPDVCFVNSGSPDRGALEGALTECRLLEVLRHPPLSSANLQFDHDLIRSILLKDIGTVRQRRLAKGLYETLASRKGPKLLSSIAYQAGLAEACLSNALKQTEAASDAGRHMEAVSALGLALSVTDQNVASHIFNVQKGRYRPSFDEAIFVAEPCLRIGLDRATRERETSQFLLSYIDHLVSVGSGGSPSIDKALTEAAMLAERLGDKVLLAILQMFHGRREFNRDSIQEAMKYHQKAEDMFAALTSTEEVRKRRSLNLVRLAITHRQLGHIEQSRRILAHALRVGIYKDWGLLTQVRANFGATFFYTDWTQTRRHWDLSLRIAKEGGLTDRYVHALIDIGHLDMLENDSRSAIQALEEALLLCREYGFENSELRCLLNLGCLALVQGHLEQALGLFRDADRLGFRHEISRRLWRVRADMATAYFLTGETDRSVTADEITLRSMPAPQSESSPPTEQTPYKITRSALAFGNIALRAQTSEFHRRLLLSISPEAQRCGRDLAEAAMENRLEELPGLLGRHCKRLAGQPFFLITE
jgi:tetratricopeptide (TPR) repeat protein